MHCNRREILKKIKNKKYYYSIKVTESFPNTVFGISFPKMFCFAFFTKVFQNQ